MVSLAIILSSWKSGRSSGIPSGLLLLTLLESKSWRSSLVSPAPASSDTYGNAGSPAITVITVRPVGVPIIGSAIAIAVIRIATITVIPTTVGSAGVSAGVGNLFSGPVAWEHEKPGSAVHASRISLAMEADCGI